MFEKLLEDNPQVSQRCKEYGISIDDVHGELIKDMIRGKISEEEPGPSTSESSATAVPALDNRSMDDSVVPEVVTRLALQKPFLLEVCYKLTYCTK